MVERVCQNINDIRCIECYPFVPNRIRDRPAMEKGCRLYILGDMGGGE